jgi:hypothetical protein
MRRSVLENNVYRWAATLIGDLADIRPEATVSPFRLDERLQLRPTADDDQRERAFG